jgi:Zn-dependent alcohol dehydrogenase
MPVESVAAVLKAFHEPLRVEAVSLRDPGPGEVLVRVVAAGVCHSDVGQADGEWRHPLPVVLGHEGAGVVEAVGLGVAAPEVGERVVLSAAPGCGGCMHCLRGRPIRCQGALAAMARGELVTGPSPLTGRDGPVAAYSLLACFAHHAVVAARSAIPLPDGVPPDVAALIGCAMLTGFGAATETLAIASGSRGAVVGAGGVGVSALQGALARGAAEVVVFDPVAERRARAEALGATASVDPGDAAALESFVRAAPRAGFEWSIVTVGNDDAIRLAIDITRPGAATAVVGLMPEGAPVPVDMLALVTYEKEVRGSAYGSLSPEVLIPRIVNLYRGGRLRLDELVTHRLPLREINDAFALSRRAEGLRPVLTISNGGSF